MFVFIVNPTSGKKIGYYISQIINEYCEIYDINHKIIYTTRKNEAKEIAESYKNRKDVTIFSVGGDGTLNEIVNGMIDSKAKLGIIPIGTGNDFYKSFWSFSGDKIDLGKVNDRYFVNVASLGLDAEIANYANKLKINKPSKKSVYVSSLIHEYFSFKPIDINIDGNQKKSTILTVCNAKYYGNGFKIAPKAKLNDGMFDVIDVKSLNKLQIIDLVLKLTKVKHLESNNVNFYRTDKVSVDSIIPLNCNIDGEIFTDSHFDFTIVKDAINVDVENSTYITNILKLNTHKLIK